MIHLNTFHTKDAMDQILDTAAQMGAKYLLVVSGDGNERLPRLKPEAIGESGKVVTSVELLRYIHQRHPGTFTCGVAFNSYEPQDHELEKMRRKVAAGAKFVCTQPVIGKDERVYALRPFGLPIIIDAWMSKKLHLLSECVGYTIPGGYALRSDGEPAPIARVLPGLRPVPRALGLQDAVLPAQGVWGNVR